MVDVQMKHLGHALRYHNEQHPQDQIILQDVMKDVIAFETNQPKGRSAAQNHFLCLLALGTAIERHKTSARGDNNLVKVNYFSDIHFSILKAFDIPQGILIGQGYNVSIADEGARYSEKERRHACHSSLKDFTTTMTETQGGTGGDMHNFDDWDLPLDSLMRLTSGTMRNLHGCMMTHRADLALRVDLLHRRDHNHRHLNNSKVRTSNQRRCRDHQPAEEHPRQPMQPSDLDQVQRLKIKPNQKETTIGLQVRTG